MRVRVLLSVLVVLLAVVGLPPAAADNPEVLDLAWAQLAGGPHIDLTSDLVALPGGGTASSVRFREGFTVGAGESARVLQARAGQDAAVILHDADGRVVWVRQISGGDGATAERLAVADDGGIVVSGVIASSSDSDLVLDDGHGGVEEVPVAAGVFPFVAVYDAEGVLADVRTWQSSDFARVLALPVGGGYALYGSFAESFELDVATTLTATDWGVFVAVLDGSWDVAWARTGEGASYTEAKAIRAHGDGIVVLGDHRGTIRIDDGGAGREIGSSATAATHLARYDLDGDLSWAHGGSNTGGSFAAYGLGGNGSGDLAVVGRFEQTGTWSGASGTQVSRTTPTDVGPSGYVVTYDADGRVRWVRIVSTAVRDASELQGVALDEDGNVFAVGFHRDGAEVDTDGAGGTEALSAADRDGLVVRYDAAGMLHALTTWDGAEAIAPQRAAMPVPGELAVLGHIQGTVDMQGTTLTSTDDWDVALVRYTAGSRIAPPDAPTAVSASPLDGGARVTWSPADTSDRPPVTSYTIRTHPTGPVVTVDGARTAATIADLPNGEPHWFTVVARNIAGESPPSAASNTVTPSPGDPVDPIDPIDPVDPVDPPPTDVSTGPATTTDPLGVDVVSPRGGGVSVVLDARRLGDETGLVLLGRQARITAPDGTVDQPLLVRIRVHRSLLAPGQGPADVVVQRDGVAVADCATPAVDPCVSSRGAHGDEIHVEVRTTRASTWTAGAPVVPTEVERLAGADRVATAVRTSVAAFPDGAAGGVVLARADQFADALAGTPLAVAEQAPLLLTPRESLDARVAQEIQRVLPAGGTVHLLGGGSALSAAVEEELDGLGFTTRRHAGPDRFATAVAIAGALGTPRMVVLADGGDFPDALAGGAAAAHHGGALVLTAGASLPESTATYLDGLADAPRYAVGGPASRAVPNAEALVGRNRFATASTVAERLFTDPRTAAVASGTRFPDALAGGVRTGAMGGPVLLAAGDVLPTESEAWLHGNRRALGLVSLYGGAGAVSTDVEEQVRTSVR